jgi:endonuclease/exonuclease/phosphatase family metal-dependent hydrolase
MHRRAFLSCLSTSLAAAGCRTQPRLPALRVLTYNTHHGEGNDGRVDLERIAAIIRRASPDVVALQELDNRARRSGRVAQAEEYSRLTGLHAQFGKAMPFDGGSYGQALLSRWPLDAFTVHSLPGPSGREPRIAVSAMVSPPSSTPFRFVGTHLDAAQDDGERWLQAGRLIELFAQDSFPTVLTGDLNAPPTSRVMQRMFGHWKDAAAHHPQPTIPSEAPRERIDYVLLHPPGAWNVSSIEVIAESVASDHRPLGAELLGPIRE